MTDQQTLFARVALGLVGAAFSIFLMSWRRLRSLAGPKFDRELFLAFAASRLGVFALVFLVLRIAPRGDVVGYYYPQAEQASRHLLPYRDFVSSYAPLHSYLDAVLILFWRTPLSIMLFSVVVELLLLPLWMRAGRELVPEGELRLAGLLYLASPISLQFVTIDGQDNVVIAVLIALAIVLILRSRVLAAGVALGGSVAAVKFLPLLYAPIFFAVVPRRWRLAIGALLVCGVVYGGFAMLRTPIMQPLAAEADLRSAGNLPYLIETIFGVTLPGRLTDACLVLVLAAIFAAVGRAARGSQIEARLQALAFGMAAATLALLALSKKSWPPYLMLAFFPICLLVPGRSTSQFRRGLRTVAFSLFSIIALTAPSYWASIFAQFSSAEFHSQLLSGRVDVLVFLGVELLLVAGYFWLLAEAIRRITYRNPSIA